MKAVIVAGGFGERLRPLTGNIPKPMIEVAGKPVLLHIIELFKKYGIEEFILALCYLPDVITSYFGGGSKFGIKIEYTFEDPDKTLGTAGAISSARKIIDDTFIVTYGDILRMLNIQKMIDFHRKKKALATLNIYKRKSKNAKSMIIFDKDNKISKFIERPKGDLKEDYIWVNGSFYIFEPKIFNFIPENRKSDFGKDIFPALVEANQKIYCFPTDSYFVDIGNMDKLIFARKTFSKVESP